MNLTVSVIRQSPFAPRAGVAKCAGQGCEERDNCLRFRRHIAPLQAWASFDIERQRLGGECPNFDKVPVRKP
jgi:hypothetical protein